MKKTLLLMTGAAVITGTALAEGKIPGVFKRNDIDKDGKLNKEEYVAARTEATQDWFFKNGSSLEAWKEKFPEPEKQFAADFSKWDTNGDGFVDVDEWKNKGGKKK